MLLFIKRSTSSAWRRGGVKQTGTSMIGRCAALPHIRSFHKDGGPLRGRPWDASKGLGRGFSSAASSATGDRLVIVGSGIAGCATALTAAIRHNIPSVVVSAGETAKDTNSYWAQGGIIYRNYDPKANDGVESLVKDILRAGAGLSVEEAAVKVATEGPELVREVLLDFSNKGYANVPFDRQDNGELSCCLEASHSAPRIIHKADHSGAAITSHIFRAAHSHPLIQHLPNTLVTDLVVEDNTCLGVQTFSRTSRQIQILPSSKGVVLASGGLAGVYKHTTNPAGFNALGSSVGLAVRAGARTRDMEFVQFHPTALHMPGRACFLLTEALRGEGALLRDAAGRAFAREFHEDGELAPRDIVARGVFAEMAKGDGTHNAFLDISHRSAGYLNQRFPSIQAHLKSHTPYDLTKEKLPITPAAHYTCGGVQTDMSGKTSVRGLYAAGESARTGLHGGNRLASTSLLEGLVFGASVSNSVHEEGFTAGKLALTKIPESTVRPFYESASAKKAAVHLLSEVRQIMWDKVGVVRSTSGLAKSVGMLTDVRKEACELYQDCITEETVALRDAVFASETVARAAFANKKSQGGHFVLTEEDAGSDDEEEAAQAAI